MSRQEKFLSTFVVVALVVLIILIGRFLNNRTGEKTGTVVRNNNGINETNLDLSVSDNFKISTFATELGDPRDIIADEKENILVSATEHGKIIALPDRDGDGNADEKKEILSGLNRPHGLAFHPRDPKKLYVAETNQVSVYDYDANILTATNKRKIIDLPSDAGHFTRSLLFLPNTENKLLISVGSSCNICNENDDRRAKVLIANDDGSDLRIYSSGLRNAVFMVEGPEKMVWVTEMGRDNLGNDLPPDEINVLKEGTNFGWPLCYGKNIPDPFGGTEERCSDKAESRIDLPAHSAPLGLAFVNNEIYPEEWRNDLLVAYHGSWNRTTPVGYKLVRLKINEKNEFEGEEDFITGWLRGRRVLGRPVDIFLAKDGKIYVSDDRTGDIYLIEYQK